MAFQFPVASDKKKKVQVFECPAVTWKERKPRAAKNKASEKMTLRQEIRKEFDDTFDSVLEFATSNLKGKEKRAHEAKKIEALGGKAAKNPSIPYKMLIGMKTKGAARKQRREDLLKESDVVTGKRKSIGKSRDQQKRKKMDYGVQATKGRFKGGVLDETTTRFTFSFFDAAHTDGYVAPAQKEFKRSDNRLTTRHGGGFFSDDEEDEDIVTKIQQWKQTNNKDGKTKVPQKQRDVHDLFSYPKKEDAQPRSNNIPPTTSDIQLTRLLDDYMLGEKGDRIMQQMEDLTIPSPVRKFEHQSKPNHVNVGGDQKAETEQQEPSLDLDAMVSMEDFEKYIARN
ncbi:hypothetical protein PHMEG_0003754 [Phytophthora megakarya]|uniref:Uncharacterized protein n=1 Tax=Phytophthora megakarya TaxID=4795 RepID=A0A225WVL1_9STRA|nr:hypothetical protein PHMEG_0003754 [Phytophthora megakarya]